jgi:hypothetical protein
MRDIIFCACIVYSVELLFLSQEGCQLKPSCQYSPIEEAFEVGSLLIGSSATSISLDKVTRN